MAGIKGTSSYVFLKLLFSSYRQKLIISREIDWTPSEELTHLPAGGGPSHGIFSQTALREYKTAYTIRYNIWTVLSRKNQFHGQNIRFLENFHLHRIGYFCVFSPCNKLIFTSVISEIFTWQKVLNTLFLSNFLSWHDRLLKILFAFLLPYSSLITLHFFRVSSC